MDIVRIHNGNRTVIKRNASEADFFNLMIEGRDRFGIRWPNAHKLIFFCRHFEFRYEWMGDIDMDFLINENL